MTQITLEAPDISCEHCIMSIQKALSKLDGVRFVSGDPADKVVVLEYDPSVLDLPTIQMAMEEEGYPVTK
jgi:copper chaperone